MSANESSSSIIVYENVALPSSLQNLFLDGKIADVNFIFESIDGQQDQIPAHKTLMAARSDVFEAMFYGTVKEKGDIKIVDATVAAFKEFLQFFYLSRLSFTNENIAYVMDLVNKYNVNGGMNICVSFLRDMLTVHNACTVYGLAILYEQEDLKQKVEDKISNNTKAFVFDSPSFLKCNKVILSHILKLNSLSCPETEVFKACIDWVKATSGMESITRVMIQTHLGDLFYNIGFGLMKIDEFSALVPLYGNLFSRDEYKEIIQMMGSNEFNSEIFKKNPRFKKGAGLIEFNRIAEVQMAEPDRTYPVQEVERMIFESNKAFMLHEIICQSLDTSSFNTNGCRPSIDVHITTPGSKIYTLNETLYLEETPQGTVIRLSHPIRIHPHVLYCVDLKKIPNTGHLKPLILESTVVMENGIKIDFDGGFERKVFARPELIVALRFSKISENSA